jgi:hypothetical protein
MVKEFLVGITSIKKILQDTLDYFFIEYDWTNSALCSNKLWKAHLYIYIYMFNVHKATSQNVYHRPVPHNKNRSSSPVSNILLCDVLYRQHLHQHTQNTTRQNNCYHL